MGELFTIGYEGRSIDGYMDLLVSNQIKVLCDVRKNPISRKPGFSKGRLRENCNIRGVGYIHFPDLGVGAENRRGLTSDRDYQDLFRFYEAKILGQSGDCLADIYNLLKVRGNVAITCFEADVAYCHRGCISASMLRDYSIAKAVNL